jgi:hypothetical protein
MCQFLAYLPEILNLLIVFILVSKAEMRIFSLYKKDISYSKNNNTSKKKRGKYLKYFLLYHKPPQK